MRRDVKLLPLIIVLGVVAIVSTGILIAYSEAKVRALETERTRMKAKILDLRMVESRRSIDAQEMAVAGIEAGASRADMDALKRKHIEAGRDEWLLDMNRAKAALEEFDRQHPKIAAKQVD